MDASLSTPFLISWNITKSCNLKCAHCYLDASELDGKGDISTSEALIFADRIAEVNPNAMLILTGGEPLLRPDIFKIARYAGKQGLTVVLGTNGTLIQRDTISRLKNSDIKGVGISLDSLTPGLHDRFRGIPGSWEKAMNSIELLKEGGIDFQIQFTVTNENKGELDRLFGFAYEKGARALNIFFLVCTGRGQKMSDIAPSEYETILSRIIRAESEYEGRMMVRARCAPHVLRAASTLDPSSSLVKGGTSGCIAGRGYLRISPEGLVTPCPYIPAAADSMSLGSNGLRFILEHDKAFKSLRNPVYNGRCAECEYGESCGGCRARALSTHGDLMGEDNWCGYIPPSNGKKTTEKSIGPVWTPEAAERLEKVPGFLMPMIKKGIESYARARGLSEITPEMMAELRKKAGRR
ncbi:MAG: radical SAM protein [Deltaproteobacteria bacterium]|nr:radical SAM protein [Deltaproteobacteria bacterium]